ncbi:regulator of (H+)-ATPase in vacuolar membrane [Rhizina undulata]
MPSAVLPGKPQAKLQAVCTVEWKRKRLIAYISGIALVILADLNVLIQTIYHDDELEAVAIDEASGKIAVCSGRHIFVYKGNGQGEGFIKWQLQSQLELSEFDGPVSALSWGNEDELLVGSKSLELYSTARRELKLLWRRQVPNHIKFAQFCYDASLAASTGEYDRLVKVWRRLSTGSEDVQFDFSYLPHPRAVTGMHWRKPLHREETIDNVLYTICADGVLRVWTPISHDSNLLHLWVEVDLNSSIPDSGLSLDSIVEDGAVGKRYMFVLDSSVVAHAAVEAVNTVGNSEKDTETLQRLIEIASKNLEVVVVVDGRGRMSAWGFENVGCKARTTTNVFGICPMAECGIEITQGEESVVLCHAFPGGPGLVILAHFFDGRICWYETRLDKLFDSTVAGSRMKLKGVWSGHSGAVETIVRSANGRALFSSAQHNEHIVWSQGRGHVSLTRKSNLSSTSAVKRAVILDDGGYIMTLHDGYVALWNTKAPIALEIERRHFRAVGEMLCLILLPEGQNGSNIFHVVAISSDLNGIAWEIRIPSDSANGIINGGGPYLREFTKLYLGPADDLLMIVSVDSVGWNTTLSGFLDKFSREVAISVSKSGFLRCWTVKVSPEDSTMRWLVTSTVDTLIETPSLAKGNSIRKVALVDSGRSELTIWDWRAAQLEYRQTFDSHDAIRDLDWTSTPDSQSILAVGFPHRVLLMCQLRYDYLYAGPAWAPFREIKIRDLTPHPIGDSIWLGDGGLVIGAGNQLFVHSRKVDDVDDMLKSLHLASHQAKYEDIFEIVSEVNGPVPVYHPQFLQQCILAGKSGLVEKILVNLHKELRSFHEEIPLDNFLSIPMEEFLAKEETQEAVKRLKKFDSFFTAYSESEEFSTFDESLASSLREILTKVPIPLLTGPEQINLAGITECVAQVKKHRRSIDENGARYLLFLRQHDMRREKPAPDMSFREIAWAFHSASQEILVDLVDRNSQGRLIWARARESGLFMWLRDTEAIKKQFEVIARNQYTQTEEKNPIDCSLHYLALKKKNVLLGLWRMASWNREQAATHKFLSNNFSEPRWKTAALKNAYALMGKHRFEYAAAFFLLADSLKDAVNVCFNQMKDMQLAIAIARVYEGDDGPVLKSLLEDKILPLAIKEGNRWLATWAFWILKKKDMAVRCLLSPLQSLMTPSESPDIESRLFLADDPALVILYKQIREKTLQTLRGVEKISPEAEFQFVLHTARLYDRMGCDILALDLVKNWDFLPAGVDLSKPLIEIAPRRHIRRRSSITVADIPSPAAPSFKTIPPVSVFQEPDMASMSWAF